MTKTIEEPDIPDGTRRPETGTDFERRAGERHRTVLQVAKLVTAQGEELCILRNVSSGGLRADIYSDLPIGEPVSFELRTGRQVAGHVAWRKDASIGVAFDTKVPILAYLAHQAIGQFGKRIRAPRIRIDEAAGLHLGAAEEAVVILDASQAGMRIAAFQRLGVGESCDLDVAGLGRRGAIVRWVRSGEAGLQLKTPLRFDEFSAWRTHARSLEPPRV